MKGLQTRMADVLLNIETAYGTRSNPGRGGQRNLKGVEEHLRWLVAR